MAAVMRMASVAPVRGAAKLSKASRTRTATLAAPKGLRGASLKVRAAADVDTETGIKKMRDGIKEASDENLLTPRFYTTDFDEMEQLFSTEINPNLDEAELVAILQEFREDFNQKHFVRNDSFKSAADGITGESRRIFIEFLERSCTAEFSGFLLYKELGRRLKKTAPVAAEIFTLMSRDEARHAGFLNKAMSDFNLALDLGFLTKNRQVRSAPVLSPRLGAANVASPIESRIIFPSSSRSSFFHPIDSFLDPGVRFVARCPRESQTRSCDSPVMTPTRVQTTFIEPLVSVHLPDRLTKRRPPRTSSKSINSTPSSSPSSSSTRRTCPRRSGTGGTSPSTATSRRTQTTSFTPSSSTSRTGARMRTATVTSSPRASRRGPSSSTISRLSCGPGSSACPCT